MRRSLCAALVGLALLFEPGAGRSAAETCSAESLGDAVDESAAELRAFSAEAQPRLKERLAALRDFKKWTDADYEQKGLTYLHDDKLDQFDSQAGELLSKIDTLGSPEAGDTTAPPGCANLADLKAASGELMAVMRAKSDYLVSKIDREVGPAPAPGPEKKVVAVAPAATAPAPVPATPLQKADAPKIEKDAAAKRPPEAKPAESTPSPAAKEPQKAGESPAKPPSEWRTTTAEAVIPPPPAYDRPQAGVPYELPPYAAPDANAGGTASEEGYTIQEIQEASRGFFGTISTSLASVIEYTFQKTGRPAAYILGKEGGGAFLAGLRYGEGTMYLRSGGKQQVFWHGPSIGSDFGLDGSRTLFLVYHLDDPDRIYRQFTGVDGSAYFVGGVGMTLLKGGNVLMAPIRSGLGFRIGANLGYVRFTTRPTWNPF